MLSSPGLPGALTTSTSLSLVRSTELWNFGTRGLRCVFHLGVNTSCIGASCACDWHQIKILTLYGYARSHSRLSLHTRVKRCAWLGRRNTPLCAIICHAASIIDKYWLLSGRFWMLMFCCRWVVDLIDAWFGIKCLDHIINLEAQEIVRNGGLFIKRQFNLWNRDQSINTWSAPTTRVVYQLTAQDQ